MTYFVLPSAFCPSGALKVERASHYGYNVLARFTELEILPK